MEQPQSVEELTIAREGDERMAPRRELKKKVLTGGSWATVMYMFEELKRAKSGDEWSEPRLALVRYRKLKGAYKFQKEFAFTNMEHVKEMNATLTAWLAE